MSPTRKLVTIIVTLLLSIGSAGFAMTTPASAREVPVTLSDGTVDTGEIIFTLVKPGVVKLHTTYKVAGVNCYYQGFRRESSGTAILNPAGSSMPNPTVRVKSIADRMEWSCQNGDTTVAFKVMRHVLKGKKICKTKYGKHGKPRKVCRIHP